MICGRRWVAGSPRCVHEQSTATADESSERTGSGEIRRTAAPQAIAGYRIGDILGSGGFGLVVAAVRERDGREVAIKTVHRDNASSCRRLTREAEALQAIGAPYVPELFDTGTLPDGSPFLVLEKLNIPSLDTKLGDPMGRIELAALANPLFTAVEVTHRRGFVHRDLKPENIFVSGTLFTARLIDFGLAKSAAGGIQSTDETMTGMLLGTPVYMSPEQCEGRADIDQRADIYALGVILYEMLTGRPPFFGKPAQVRGAHINRRPPPPSHTAAISPAFDQVLLRCLAKEPERRFNTIRELRRALSEAMERESEVIRAPVPAVRLPAEPERQQLVGLIFFDASSTAIVLEQLSALGGQLVYVAGERHVAAFGLGSSGNPIERAFESAKALVEQGIGSRVIVDRDRAKVHRSPDGTRRVLTAAFRDESCFPRPGDPSGILVTERAAEGLGPLQSLAIPEREGIRRALPKSPMPSAENPARCRIPWWAVPPSSSSFSTARVLPSPSDNRRSPRSPRRSVTARPTWAAS